MKVSHFCTTDFGGAFYAAARINAAMRQCGADSRLFVRTKTRKDTECIAVADTPVKELISKTKNFANLILSKGEIITDRFGTDITKTAAVKDADVIILHWVNSFISYSTVKKLAASGKAVIWVMHDMWPYTGGCHHGYGCTGYEHGCGKCPFLKSTDENDLSRRNFLKKQEALNAGNITIVSPSIWNMECSEKSAVTSDLKKHVIRNPIDTTIFNPQKDAASLREKYGLPLNKKIILFGAMVQSVHKWEGMEMTARAVSGLNDDLKKDCSLLIFGNAPDLDLSDFDIPAAALGHIDGQEKIADIYRAADVFVSPSVADNYPNTLLEAICCGTPCVSFDIGGMRDLVKTGETGYLARPKDTDDLSKGICTVLTGSLKEKLKDPSHNKNLSDNSYDIIGKQYVDLCEALMR
ncbi:MAG: glycosyltransferase [Lachnospiraceae bacterium]|nr:glycosyltransferase [Lachnospiraceae bacterium]